MVSTLSRSFVPSYIDFFLPSTETSSLNNSSRKRSLIRKVQCNQSKFFEAAFNGSFAEASNGVVNLPEELPRTFEIVHTWLYTGELTRAIGTEDVECTPNHNIELYVFSDKYTMPKLCIKAMDQLLRDYEEKGVVETNMAFVYRKTVGGSPLRRLFVAIITCVPARSEVFHAEVR